MMRSTTKKGGRRLRSARRNRNPTQRRVRRGRTIKGGFKIIIKSTILKAGKRKDLEVDGGMTVADLKTLIAENLKSSVRVMLVVPQAQPGRAATKEYRELQDDYTLAQSGVTEGSELEVIPRTQGSSVGSKDIGRAIWS